MTLTILAFLNVLVAAWLSFYFIRALRTGKVQFGGLEFARGQGRLRYTLVTTFYFIAAIMCLIVSAEILLSGSSA